MPAVCSLAVVKNHGSRNHVATYVANLEAWCACTLVLAYDAEALPCSVQEESCTCLLWSGCQAHVAQQIPVPMLPDLASLSRHLSCYQPQSDHSL